MALLKSSSPKMLKSVIKSSGYYESSVGPLKVPPSVRYLGHDKSRVRISFPVTKSLQLSKGTLGTKSTQMIKLDNHVDPMLSLEQLH